MQKKLSTYHTATIVTDIRPLNNSVVELVMEHKDHLHYRAGQSVTLMGNNGLSLSNRYSIANSRSEEKTIKIHVTRSKMNPFSLWVHDELTIGETLSLDRPRGQCFYQSGNSDQTLVLIGTECGLAPLSGILQDAFKHNHTGRIYLFHGARDVASLYWVSDMTELMQKHPNFWYSPCTSSGYSPRGYKSGQACDVAVDTLSNSGLHEWCVFLYGSSAPSGQAMDAISQTGTIQKEIDTRVFSARHETKPAVDASIHLPEPCIA